MTGNEMPALTRRFWQALDETGFTAEDAATLLGWPVERAQAEMSRALALSDREIANAVARALSSSWGVRLKPI